MLTDLLHRLRALFRRRAVERDIDDELRFHFDRQVEKYTRAGHGEAEAVRRARLEFGGLDQIKEEYRDSLGVRLVNDLVRDGRQALRALARDTSFTIAVLLTLAICVGANTAMFSIVRSVILKPLPFPDSDRLVLVYNSYPNFGAPRGGASASNYYDRQAAVPAFEDLALFQRDERRLGDAQGVERVGSLRATPSLLRMLGVQPVQGRLFLDEEAQPGHDSFVLLGYDLWQRKFAGAPIVNETIRLNEAPTRVVGILPPGFSFLTNDIEIVEPLAFDDARRSDDERYQMVARLGPDATIAMAQAQIAALNASLEERFPEWRQRIRDAGFHTVVVSLQEDVVRDVKAMLYLLWGGVAFVLVIGCFNVANLMIVRAGSRTREMATRHAIGGDLGQLARLLLAESTLLALAGGALGVALGASALRSVEVIGLDQLPRGHEIGLDPAGVVIMLALTAGIGVVLGVAPVVRLRRMNLNAELREEGRSGTTSRRAHAGRTIMATAQFAIAFVVLAGAGLLFASFKAATDVNLGFEAAGVATVTVELPTEYRNRPAQSQYVRRTIEVLRGLPEVEAAGVTTLVPLSGSSYTGIIAAERQAISPGASLLTPSHVIVTSGFFEAMGVSLAAGRQFDDRDTADAPSVVMIDDRLARTLWPGENAVGRRLYFPEDPSDPGKISPTTQLMAVVGVVQEMRFLPPQNDVSPTGAVFYPYDQRPITTITFVVKARMTTDATGRVRAAMTATDPQVPVYRLRSMEDWIDRAFVGRRAPMIIAVLFAVVSMLLSAIGVYGVVAHGVAQRRRELAVRMALGGTAGEVFRLMLVKGLRIVAAGLAIGLVGAYFAGQVMRAQLFGVAPTSATVLLGVAAGLGVVALVASVVPAWRASRIDPVVVLGR
jgi:predicted permease